MGAGGTKESFLGATGKKRAEQRTVQEDDG